ncbi:MAG: hypothetical protein WC760_02350 [Bacteroidia bacterium]|jgi:tetratricopeptide (TPR) repeat protein
MRYQKNPVFRHIQLTLRTGFLMLGLFLFNIGYAQIQADTLRLIYNSLQRSDFKSADVLLRKYEQAHPNNTIALQLHAEVYTYMGAYKKADALYSELIIKEPDNHNLICSYADFLAIKGQYARSMRMLGEVLQKAPQNERAIFLRAKINYWKGENRLAMRQLMSSPTSDQKLRKDVALAKSPVLNYRILFADDNQPVQSLQHLFSLQQTVSSKWNPQLQFSFNQYDGFQKMQTGVANTFKFPDLKLDIKLSAGIYNTFLNGSGLMDPVWALDVGKSMFRYWKWEAYMREIPYLYNMHSLREHILQRESGVALNFNHPKGVLAKASYQVNSFTDDNAINCFYAWALLPLIHQPRFKFSVGYGYNYSDTREVRFRSPDSTSTLISNFNPDQEITGRYYPYFTPIQQTIHSLLAGAELKISSKLLIRLNASYGIAANSQLPYVYLDNINGLVDQHTGLASHTFTPYDFIVSTDYKLGSYHTLGLTYEYVKNNFYTNQQVSASLKMQLTHEK